MVSKSVGYAGHCIEVVLVVTYSHFPTVLLSNSLTLTLSNYTWPIFFYGDSKSIENKPTTLAQHYLQLFFEKTAF